MVGQAICPRCKCGLPADAPEGLCPECLFGEAVRGLGSDPVRPAIMDLPGHFPRLEILGLVGEGGMGAVYKARQPSLDRLVAVKVLPGDAGRDPTFAERFSREARSLARFSHPNIVTVYDFGEADGLCYILMEFVAGKNLRQILETGGLTEAAALRIATQVCDALEYAQDVGVVHRDIKPENILLDARGQVKVADFGLAKLVGLGAAPCGLTGSRDALGTLYYVAPEQLLRPHQVDHRADLYSLGVVLYELLTGELPVGRFDPPSERAGVDGRLDPIVLRALAPDPRQRFQDAGELRREIEAVLGGGVKAPAVRRDPTATRTTWPCVRFTIPSVSWMGAFARGEAYRDETALILDFSVVGALGSSTHKEVRLPLEEIHTIACRTDSPGWIAAWRETEIVLKTSNPATLAGLPAGPHGRGRLQVHRADREAAEKLVESILRSPRLGRAAPKPVPAARDVEFDRVRRQLVGPAVGLLVTASVSGATALGLAIALFADFDRPGRHPEEATLVAVAMMVMLLGTWLMVRGALRMMRGRSYLACVVAALVAVVPWSGAWFIGLPVGVWALVVLGRREVMLAFLRNGGPPPEPAPHPEPPGRMAGKLRSFWRSFLGYFITIPGERAREWDAKWPRK